jgi:cell wall-associated NlpC family hydrolase
MTSYQSTRIQSFRRVVVAAAVATATVSTLAVPLTAHAAPAGAISSVGQQVSRRATVDPVGVRAAEAVSAIQRALLNKDTASMKAFDQIRDRLAVEIAVRLEVDPARLQAAWQRADREHQLAIVAALSQLGVPYRRNTSRPGEGFDCSGLTAYAWGQAGFELRRQSTAQIRASAPVTDETAQAGDLVQYPGHVMMWLGVDRAIVHAPYTGRDVEVDHVSDRHTLRWGDPTG